MANPDAPVRNPGTPRDPNPAPIGTPTPPAHTPTQAEFATLRAILTRYGLISLYDRAVEWMVSGIADSPERLELALRETTEFQTRFRGLFDREANGLPPISVDEYLQYEDMAFQTLRELGYPPGFYDDPDDFADAIGNNVSMNEFRQRAEVFADLAGAGREQIRAQLAQHMGPDFADALDGLSDTEIAAWTMDADRALPAIRQRLAAAQVSAGAADSGFGSLSYSEATGLAGRGVDEGQARQAFAALQAQGDVTRALAGETDAMDRESQLGVVAGNADDLTELERRRSARLGAFRGGGTFAGDREGLGGLGRS